MANLKKDLYRRPAGWDYVTMDVPGFERPVAIYIRQAERGHLQLLFDAPTEINIDDHQIGIGGPRKP